MDILENKINKFNMELLDLIDTFEIDLEELFVQYKNSKRVKVIEGYLFTNIAEDRKHLANFAKEAKKISNESRKLKGGSWSSFKQSLKNTFVPNKVEMAPLYNKIRSQLNILKKQINHPNHITGKYTVIYNELGIILKETRLFLEKLKQKLAAKNIEINYHTVTLEALNNVSFHTRLTPSSSELNSAYSAMNSVNSSPKNQVAGAGKKHKQPKTNAKKSKLKSGKRK